MTLEKEKLEKAAFILKTVAHPVRLAIIQHLGEDKRMSVNELGKRLACEQSLLSHHLINMKLKGILMCEQEGQNRYYSLKEPNVLKLLSSIEQCDCMM
ncbi:MAG: metalloregulator ArsR/SmtB family transcription factor [Siphonobacter sp.]